MRNLQYRLAALYLLGMGLLPSVCRADMPSPTNSVDALFGTVDYASGKGSAIVLGFIGFGIALGMIVWVGRKSGFRAK